jgi:hypothetical protein
LFMEIIILEPGSNAELVLIQEFLDRTGIKSRVITDDDKEDFVLSLMMQGIDYTDTIDARDFINSLLTAPKN